MHLFAGAAEFQKCVLVDGVFFLHGPTREWGVRQMSPVAFIA